MGDVFPILNPQTPLAFLPPDIGHEFQTSFYIIIASEGAFLWDLIENLPSDYRLLVEHKLSFPTVIYFVSRLSVLASNIVNATTQTAPIGFEHCKTFMIVSCVLYHIAFSSVMLLFFLRVRAVFDRNKYIVAFFFLLWLGVVGGTITLIFASSAAILNPTDYCLVSPMKPLVAASPITVAVMDTCVFLAISWRLLSTSWEFEGLTTSTALKRLMLGHNLPSFTRTLLQDGQIYYLFSTLTNIASLIIITLPSVPAGYRFMYMPNCSITNMMACRVYRNTKFGRFREDSISTTFILSQARAEIQDEQDCGTKEKINGVGAGSTTHRRLEHWRSRLLLAVTLFALIFIPVLCVSLCVSRKHRESMRQ